MTLVITAIVAALLWIMLIVILEYKFRKECEEFSNELKAFAGRQRRINDELKEIKRNIR